MGDSPTVPPAPDPGAARAPEILAPAGDRDSLAAALAAGADAVYFGLDDGFNARARAANFPSAELGEVIAQIHRAGVRACVTLNTLVFEPELPVVEALIRRVAAAGADVIVICVDACSSSSGQTRRASSATAGSCTMIASTPAAATPRTTRSTLGSSGSNTSVFSVT